MLPDFFLVGADGQLQVDFVGNDVVARAAVDGADRDHGGIEGRNLAADDGLNRHHQLRGFDDGILARFGA